MLGEVKKTQRGFEYIEFEDLYHTPCSIQQSSLAVTTPPGSSALWLGVEDAMPKVLASQAAFYGVQTDETTGWVSYPIPDGVLLTTRMHLSTEQVQSLIEVLQRWLDTCSLGQEEEQIMQGMALEAKSE